MKKIVSILLILLSFTNLYAQHSTSAINDIITLDFKKIIEKYDFEEDYDDEFDEYN